MRRIDIFTLGFALLLGGGALYALLQGVGVSAPQAGIWTEAALVLGLVGWLVSYLVRAASQKMTYIQQRRDYEDARLQKRLDSLSPEELEQLQRQVGADEEERSPES